MIDATRSAAIPSELRARDQWVAWRSEERHGKRTKVPYTPADQPGGRASTTDPATWGSFDQAVAAGAWADGIGFVFSADDPYVGVDLDHCIADDGVIHPDAAGLVAWLNSYAEVSPSGTGLHVIARGEVPGTRHRTADTPWGDEIECYDTGRYFCFTGNVVPGLAVNEPPPVRQNIPSPRWWTPDQPLRYDKITFAQDAQRPEDETPEGADERVAPRVLDFSAPKRSRVVAWANDNSGRLTGIGVVVAIIAIVVTIIAA